MRPDTPIPPAVARLPRDKHGHPIPWFVHTDEAGTPDFRVIRRDGLSDAVRFELCWVCGQRRGRHAAFVVGPMCTVNKTSAEPPAHLPCAVFSAQACPFLTTPGMRRRDRGLPEDRLDPAGVAIMRNPGVAVVWSSRTWYPFRAPTPSGGTGTLFDMGEATAVSWWAQGRPATREEAEAAIASGLPILEDVAAADGDTGRATLAGMAAAARALLPGAA